MYEISIRHVQLLEEIDDVCSQFTMGSGELRNLTFFVQHHRPVRTCLTKFSDIVQIEA